jgi:cyclophilin family peptidyl-prolyl cis-trans isomerase
MRRLVALTAVAVLLAACGDSGAPLAEAAVGGEQTTTTTTTTAAAEPTSTLPEITLPVRPPSDYAGFIAQSTACGGSAPEQIAPMVFPEPEDQGLDPGQTVQAIISTSCGDITVELDPRIAPETVNSFVFLAREGFFDGTVSHRVLPGFVMQAGDPTATGREGPGYTIPDELPAAGFIYERGTLAMANSGPNTTGSQFFIMLGDAPLSPDYSVFGKVVEGFETLDLVAALPLGVNPFGETSVPLETLYLEQVTIPE